MSQYFCSIVDNALRNPAQRMYFDLGDYRYGLTVVGDGEPIVCFMDFLNLVILGIPLTCQAIVLIRIDLIGHGDSDIPEEGEAYTIPKMIEDLHTVIYHMVGDRYYLMGYSMGARIALSYALEYESEIKGSSLKVALQASPLMMSEQSVVRPMKTQQFASKTMMVLGLLHVGRRLLFLKVKSSFYQRSLN